MNSERKRIYIVVKTYPNISKTYSELVCTAGVLEDGSWIRLYPVPFRKLDIDQKYPKYSWINVDVVKNTSDGRPESYRPVALSTLEIEREPKPNKTPWHKRRDIIFKDKKVYTNIDEIIGKALDEKDGTSLAIFKPSKLVDLICEPTERDWPADKLAALESESQQLNLFQTPEEIEKEFKVVNKLPYKFSYLFEDDSGKTRKMMISDWEIGMLYFNCLRGSDNDEAKAIEKVRGVYWERFSKCDIHFFIGTTLVYQRKKAPNPFIIIGVFYPPMDHTEQMSLF